jgi:hypothetical protein
MARHTNGFLILYFVAVCTSREHPRIVAASCNKWLRQCAAIIRVFFTGCGGVQRQETSSPLLPPVGAEVAKNLDETGFKSS